MYLKQSKRVLVLLPLLYLGFTFIVPPIPAPLGDALDYFYTGELLAETGSPVYNIRLNSVLNTYGFTYRHLQWCGGRHVPRGHPGLIIISAIESIFIGYWRVVVTGPFFSALSLLLLYKLCTRFFSEEDVLRMLVVVGVSPFYFYYSTRFLPVMISFSMFLLVLLLMMDKKFFASGVLMGALIWMRYPNVILFPVFAVLLIYLRECRLKPIAEIAIGSGILIIPLLFYNLYIYGGLLKTGIECPAFPGEHTKSSAEIAVDFYSKPLLNHVLLFPIIGSLSFPALVFASIGLAASSRNKKARKLILISVTTFILLFFFYAPRSFEGEKYSNMGPESSLIRYWLPMFALLGVFTVEGVKVVEKWLGKSGVRHYIYPALVLVTVLATVFVPYGGLLYTYNQKQRYLAVRNTVLGKTPGNAVVFAGFWDKVIYPDRITFIYWYPPDREENLRVIGELLSRSIPVYLLQDRDDKSQDEYILENTKHVLIEQRTKLYKITGVIDDSGEVLQDISRYD